MKKLFSIREIYNITYKMFLSLDKLISSKRADLLDILFVERIMLATTEVNDCPACSYGHSKIALEAGLSSQEIENMLSGVKRDVPQKELAAIMFAQHYAEYRGEPTKQAWERIREVYGEDIAQAILANIRLIMLGNAYGIAWGSFVKRFKGEADSRSNILYELSVVILTLPIISVAAIFGLLSIIFRRPKIKFA